MRSTYLVGLLYMTTWHMVIPLVPVFASSVGASPVQVGLVVSSIVVLSTILCVHLGNFADTFGAARLARGAAVTLVGALAAVSASRTLWHFALSLSIFGLADIALVIATQTSVASLSSSSDRPGRFATLSLWGSVGPLIGPALGGALATRWGYHAAFLSGLALAVCTLATTWWIPNRPASDTSVGTTNVIDTYRRSIMMLRDRPTALIVVLSFGTMFAFSLRSSFFPVYLSGAGYSTALIGSLLSWQAACSMLARPILPYLVARMGEIRLMAAAVTGVILALSLTPQLSVVLTLGAVMATLGVSSGFVQPLRLSMISTRVGPGTYGTAFSLQVTAMQFSQLVAPTLCGLAAGVLGIGAAFYVGALVAAGGLAAVLGLARTNSPIVPSTVVQNRTR